MKTCSKCRNLMDLENFSVTKTNRDGRDNWCKNCRSEYFLSRYKRKLPEMYQDDTRRQCRRCEKILSITKFRSQGGRKLFYCLECTKFIGHAYNLKNLGLTIEKYMEIYEEQKGLCKICGNPEFTKKRLSVDHDHRCCPGKSSCGKCIRGLLCFKCNTALGMVSDNIAILSNMISYLKM